MKRWIADAVSLSRVALLLPWIGCPRASAPAFLAAILATDLLDGPIARRLGTAGSRGALTDAACDALVVVAATIAFGSKDPQYVVLAGLMVAAFVSYGACSLSLGRFAYSRLGRYDGAVCYVVVATASLRPWLEGLARGSLAAAEWVLIGLAAAVLGVSTAENVAGLISTRISRRKSVCLS